MQMLGRTVHWRMAGRVGSVSGMSGSSRMNCRISSGTSRERRMPMTRKTILAPREWPTSVNVARCSGVRRMIFSANRMAKLSASAWACSGVSFRGQSWISMEASKNVFLMSVTSSGSRFRVARRSKKLVGVIWLSFPERLTCQSGMNQTVWRAAEAVMAANRTKAANVLNNVFISCPSNMVEDKSMTIH